MWQQLDCNVAYATTANPSGCRDDLFPWVEVTVGAGTNGNPQPTSFTDETDRRRRHLHGLLQCPAGRHAVLQAARQTVHAPPTTTTSRSRAAPAPTASISATPTSIWYTDGNGHTAKPPANQIENPESASGHQQLVYPGRLFGGHLQQLLRPEPAGRGDRSPPTSPALQASAPNCVAGPLLPGEQLQSGLSRRRRRWPPRGAEEDRSRSRRVYAPTIGDVLIAHQVSWAYYGEGWNAFVADPDAIRAARSTATSAIRSCTRPAS